MKRNRPFQLFTILALIVFSTSCDKQPVFETIDNIEQRLEGKIFVGDELATANYQRLEKAFDKGNTANIKLNLYRLEDPAADPIKHLRDRAAHFDLKSNHIIFPDGEKLTKTALENLPEEVSNLGMVDDQYELSYDRKSGTELLLDRWRFHAGNGVDPEKIQSDGYYADKARQYIDQNFDRSTTGVRLYNYKIRHYMDALAEEGKAPKITVSQVAVAFNTAVDGLAVIGPGSRVAVHMTPEGEVVAHETTIRPALKKVTELSAKDLLAPDEARRSLEGRLKARDINLEHYTLARAEFGYYRRGRNSVQELLAPHYAFIYLPGPGDKYSKKLVEVVPAVSNKNILALIDEDDQKEIARKRILMGEAVADDERPAQQ